jgi:hypothetical protein
VRQPSPSIANVIRLAHGKVAACVRRAASRVYGEVMD